MRNADVECKPNSQPYTVTGYVLVPRAYRVSVTADSPERACELAALAAAERPDSGTLLPGAPSQFIAAKLIGPDGQTAAVPERFAARSVLFGERVT